jgi:Ca-activated chloride channel family protein
MKRIFLTASLFALISGTAVADGVLIPRPEPWMPPRPTVDVKYHYVDVDINDPVATTKIDQVFVNPYHRDIEADYIFPIPEGAAIGRFTAWLGGHKMEAELLDADQARRTYEEIVRRMKDPALLEYAGRGMYRIRIFPIPARGEVRFKIEYDQTLKSDNGLVEYLYPLNTEKYSGRNLEECKVDLHISSFENIGTVYCPSHKITSNRLNDKAFRAEYRQRNVKPDKDFVLHFTRQKKDFGFHLLSYRQPGSKDGFFLGILSPPLRSADRSIDKNLIFVLDSSGSMRGEKMQQAIEALKFCLLGLNPGDEFAIIDYDDQVKPYRSGLLPADDGNIREAVEFAERVEASGGTDIFSALDAACRIIPADNDPTFMIFLTDGLPTSGNTSLDDIIRNTAVLNEERARLFAFGVGYDVNAHLLDRLSNENKGVAEYVLPEEDIEVKVSRFASKISFPALTDISLTFNPRDDATYIYPDPLPDLFHGSEMVIAGRFRQDGQAHALVSGYIGRHKITYEFPVSFSGGSAKDDYVALIWANRRINYLLQEMRLHGSSDELLTEVIELSKKYGIITEYTSFLITGDENTRYDRFWQMPAPEASRELEKSMSYLGEQESGRSAVNQSQYLNKQARSAQAPVAGQFNADGEWQSYRNAQNVGSQAFFQSGSNWIQSDISEDKFDIQIKRFSEAYFQLIEHDPSLGRYMSLGNEVRFRVGSQIVQIADSGKAMLSEQDLEKLFPN